MSADVLVFYAGQVHWTFEREKQFHDHRRNSLVEQEIYNGAYVFFRNDGAWERMDGTPVLLVDVPKQLRVITLLLS